MLSNMDNAGLISLANGDAFIKAVQEAYVAYMNYLESENRNCRSNTLILFKWF